MNVKYLFFLSFVCMISSCSSSKSIDYLNKFYSDRQEQLIHLVSGEHAPLKVDELSNISHFPYQPQYRVKATFKATPDEEPFDMSTVSGQTKQFIKVGTLNYKINQQKENIHVYQEVRFINHPMYGSHYFIPFNDDSNGDQTYGGGRYIDMEKSLFDSKTITLDFNKSYNPWCAYAEGYNCPIPPAENHQNIAILAGEQSYKKTKSH